MQKWIVMQPCMTVGVALVLTLVPVHVGPANADSQWILWQQNTKQRPRPAGVYTSQAECVTAARETIQREATTGPQAQIYRGDKVVVNEFDIVTKTGSFNLLATACWPVGVQP